MNIMDMKPIKTTKPTWRNLIEKLEDAGQRNPDPKELIAEIPILEQFYNLHLEKDNPDPGKKVLDFLKAHEPDAFTPETRHESQPPSNICIDGDQWLASAQYLDFVDEIYDLYRFLVDRFLVKKLIEDSENNLSRLLNYAEIWARQSLGIQLQLPTITPMLLGWSAFAYSPFEEDELWVEFCDRTETAYGIRCIGLLQKLCTALFSAVKLLDIKDRSPAIEKRRLEIKKRGKGNPETEDYTGFLVFGLCHADETSKLPKCKNIFLQALKGCPKLFCSNGCRRRWHEFNKR